MHDSYVVVSLLKAIPVVLTVKILAILPVAKGLAPWASVWCGGEWANAYPVKSLGGGSYTTVHIPVDQMYHRRALERAQRTKGK